MTLTDFILVAVTDPGHKRKDKPNQDDVLVLDGNLVLNHFPLLMVVDGMGGYEGGAVASRLVKESIAENYERLSGSNTDIKAVLKYCIEQAHISLRSYAAENPELGSMGCALVIVVLTSDSVYVANVGDSRAYIFGLQKMLQINYDHSEVADLIRAGSLTPLQALRHPRRNRLTRSLSARRKNVEPFINRYDLLEDEVILLCSDGLWGVISEAVLRAVVLEIQPQEAAEKLITLARNFGGPDNISVAIACRKSTHLQLSQLGDDETNPGL